MRIRVFTRGAACALLLLVSVPAAVHAEDSDIAALRQQLKEFGKLIEGLTAKVDKFDARLNQLEQLEQQRRAAGGAAAGTAGGATTRGAQVTSPSPSARRDDSPQVQPPPPPAEASPVAGPVAATLPQAQSLSIRESWLKMSDGMTEAEISGILGPPQKTFVINGKTVWYYVYPGIGAASVFFNPDGRASSHQAPPSGPFW